MRGNVSPPNLSTAVIGLQYGDEGKGQIVDIIAAKCDVVVRYNGGANAGHSVAIGDEKYVLHQVPIGVLTPNKQNVLANGVVVSIDPLLEEMTALSGAGIDLSGLRISDRAHVVSVSQKIYILLIYNDICPILSSEDIPYTVK